MSRGREGRTYNTGSTSNAISCKLLAWFATCQRDLPWRRSRDPYRIWVSEVMLQQTRVDTVIPYYERWCARFPNLASLAAAPEADVLKAWEGLGYYSRARNLHSAVREVAERYDGQVPDNVEALSRLKGVGPYTAGALLSIAFDRPIPAVDGNVMRVLSRLFLIRDDITLPATRQGMARLAQHLIPTGKAGAFNQALMELGALLCTPISPKCLACPVALDCQALREGVQQELPVKSKAKAPRPVEMTVAVIRQNGRTLIRRRPPQGLLGGLWEFPGVERSPEVPWELAIHQVGETHGIQLEPERYLGDVRHVFSHLIWNLRAYLATPAPGSRLPDNAADLAWVALDELDRFAFSVAHHKVIKLLRN